MRYVDFGRTGLKVSQLALGTGMLGSLKDGSVDRDQARLVLTGYVAAGGNFIDSSDAYQGGESEALIGSFLSDQRNDLVIASKYSRTAGRDASPASKGNHRKAMVQSVEASLKRLKTDRIDVYFAHYDDGITPIEEIMRGFDSLVSAGKIVYAGLSNFSAWRSAQAATTALLRGWTPLTSLEVEYSLLQRGIEREILPFAREIGLGVLAYSPLAAGVLTLKGNGKNNGAPSRMGIPPEADMSRVLETLSRIASELGAEPSDVALAWIGSKGAIPVIGARTPAQMESNLRAADTTIPDELIKHLDTASEIPLGYPQTLYEVKGSK